MSFVQISGPVLTESFTKTASTAIASGGALAFTSGQLVKAAAATLVIAGISCRDVTSGSSDYAAASPFIVNIPHKEAVYLATVSAGTPTAANVGLQYDLSSTGESVDVTGTTYKQVTVVGFIDATHLLVKFNEAVASIA